MRNFALAAVVAVYWLLHQDLWNWRAARPLVFGFLPPALSYHALYTLGVAVLMAVLVRVAWPHHLESPSDATSEPPGKSSPGGRD